MAPYTGARLHETSWSELGDKGLFATLPFQAFLPRDPAEQKLIPWTAEDRLRLGIADGDEPGRDEPEPTPSSGPSLGVLSDIG